KCLRDIGGAGCFLAPVCTAGLDLAEVFLGFAASFSSCWCWIFLCLATTAAGPDFLDVTISRISLNWINMLYDALVSSLFPGRVPRLARIAADILRDYCGAIA